MSGRQQLVDLVAQHLDVAKLVEISLTAIEKSVILVEETSDLVLEVVDIEIPPRFVAGIFVCLVFILFYERHATWSLSRRILLVCFSIGAIIEG